MICLRLSVWSSFIYIVSTICYFTLVSECTEVIRLDSISSRKVARSGTQVTLLCSLIEGDDVRFSWLKDNAILNIARSSGITVYTDETSSKVTLKKVTSSDSGVYTCVARNDVSTDRVIVELIIEG